jgi:FSR family fosmidomycin resistance protein-like MFS transporter
MIRMEGPIVRVSIAHLVTDLYMPVLTAVLPLLISGRGYSYLMAGLLVTSYNITSSVLQPVFAWLSDRTGWRIPLALSLLVFSVFICLIGLIEGYPLLLACASVAAIGHAAFDPVALSTGNRL